MSTVQTQNIKIAPLESKNILKKQKKVSPNVKPKGVQLA
jgi:hypothetical protein